MKVVMDRSLCDASLSFCQRCSAAFIRYPEGEDRICIREITEDGSDLLTIELHTGDRIIQLNLNNEMREIASVEGWESLVNFDSEFFREGAAERWRQISHLPLNDAQG